MYRKIKLSVRNLVESVLRQGSIDDSYRSMSRAVEGTKAHQKVQGSYGAEYRPEVTMKHRVEYENFIIELQGRADGIFKRIDGIIIEEIKSTNMDLEEIDEDFNELHWAQAKCYGYIYMVQEGIGEIQIQLTYFHLESEETKEFIRSFSLKDLEEYFLDLIDRYVEWANITFYWLDKRDKSIGKMDFPFEDYRKGQRELAVAVYGTIEKSKKIFVQAPTGIGKTMSTLFPAIKSLNEGLASKIFYLTAKTITRQAPLASVKILARDGLRIKTIVITAKEKICINDELKCNPRDCQFAKGHFDRVNDGIRDIFENEDIFNRETIIEYSRRHRICPFEFSLDVAMWADIIICDYNYVFNPQVQLKRFFDMDKEDYVFLIDEAHNLVDRARDMYSASLVDRNIEDLIMEFKDGYRSIYKGLNKLLTIFDIVNEKIEGKKEYYSKESIDDFYGPIRRLMTSLDKWLVEEKDNEKYDQVLDLYFSLMRYNKIQDLYDEHYLTSFENKFGGYEISLNCIDPSYLLKQVMEKGRANILFSATLSPLEYYMDLLGGTGRDYHMILDSPFPRENLCLLISSNISTRYKDRERTYPMICRYIETFISAKDGNYLIFFPSYSYMERIYEIFIKENRGANVSLQENNMDERDREEFLDRFDKEENLIAFAVVGGIFSEGIDLVGDKLIGAAIVGVGMPKIGFERNMMKDYYDEYMGEGFDYAYTYPGMNKVLQASGRVIRSPEDRGALLLIDDRYGNHKYREIFPSNWKGYRYTRSLRELERNLSDFWMED